MSLKANGISVDRWPDHARIVNVPRRVELTVGPTTFSSDPEAIKGEDLFFMYSYKVKLPSTSSDASLHPVGDLHCDLPGFCKERWEMWKERTLQFPSPIIIGMGDYGDRMSRSEREAMGNANQKLHEGTKDVAVKDSNNTLDWLDKEFSGMRDQGATIAAMGEGNHHFIYPDGSTITQKLCTRLGCQYLGVMWVLGFQFEEENSPHKFSLDVVGHHGLGAARLIGGSINRVQQLAEGIQADIHLMGHDHKKSVGTDTIMIPVKESRTGIYHLKERTRYYLRTGSFLRGYEPGLPSYIAGKALRPTDLGAPHILIRRWNRGGNRRFELEAAV